MISVVIPAYNNPGEVDRLLASIRRQCPPDGRYEVLVVDDGSRDARLRDVCAGYETVRYLRLPENAGAATARNAGVKAARFGLLLFLDSDMVVLSDVVALAERVFQDPAVEAAVGAVTPESMNPGLFRRFWAIVKAFSLPSGPYSSTFYPMIGVMRRSAFERVGGFNERIKGASIEDYDISFRMEQQGCRVHYHPELLVGTHYKPALKSLSQSFSRSMKWFALFWERRRFDNHTTTGSQAAGVLCGAGAVALLLLALAGLVRPVWPLLLLAGYVGINWRFFRYAASIAGAGFLPVAIGCHLILSLVVAAGVGCGALQLLLGPGRRRALLSR